MAFTSIALDGYGLYAACDAIADTAGGDWTEVGGGTVTYEVTDPLVGSGSIGIEYASKSGIVLFTSDFTLDFAGTGTGNATDQLIGIWIKIASNSAFEVLTSAGLQFVAGTDGSNYRTWKINSSDDNNNWGTGWKYFVFDINNIGDGANDVGTFNPATINVMGLLVDTIISVRAPTIFIDQIMVYNGLRVKGTGTLDEIITYCTDYTNRAYGIFQEREGIYYSYGQLIVGDNTTATENTALTDNGNVMQYGKSEYYHDTNGWSLTHSTTYNNILLEKHASYTTNYTSEYSSLFGIVGAKLSMVVESGATLSQVGGALKVLSSFTTYSGETTEGKILTAIDSSSISNTPLKCSWLKSGLITIQSGGGLNGCTIDNATGTVALNTANPSLLIDTDFISNGSGHATELTTTGTYDWDINFSGYGADSTTDAVVYNNSGGAITLNVTATGTSPTVFNGTNASTNVVVGQTSFKFTVDPSFTGYEWRIYTVTALGSQDGAVEIAGEEISVADNQTYNYTYTTDGFIAVQVISSIDDDYIELVQYYTLGNTNQNVILNLKTDTNN